MCSACTAERSPCQRLARSAAPSSRRRVIVQAALLAGARSHSHRCGCRRQCGGHMPRTLTLVREVGDLLLLRSLGWGCDVTIFPAAVSVGSRGPTRCLRMGCPSDAAMAQREQYSSHSTRLGAKQIGSEHGGVASMACQTQATRERRGGGWAISRGPPALGVSRGVAQWDLNRRSNFADRP